ncbi:MAG TPA: hypothetical protein QF564_16450, partial [Pirellulaceae bacterium]|nr:hypothetical protein [Pirellulaceae bacterium]
SDWPPSFGFGGYSKTSLLPKSPNRREATFLPRQQKSESLQAGEVTDFGAATVSATTEARADSL